MAAVDHNMRLDPVHKRRQGGAEERAELAVDDVVLGTDAHLDPPAPGCSRIGVGYHDLATRIDEAKDGLDALHHYHPQAQRLQKPLLPKQLEQRAKLDCFLILF